MKVKEGRVLELLEECKKFDRFSISTGQNGGWKVIRRRYGRNEVWLFCDEKKEATIIARYFQLKSVALAGGRL